MPTLFPTRRFIPLLLCLAACDSEAPHEPILEQQFSVASLPMRGACDVTSVQLISFQPPILNQLSTGTCQFTHLGRVALRTVQFINVTTGAQNATSTFTSGSGDRLLTSSTGQSTPTGPGKIDFSGTTTITGGTGRFSGASGQMGTSGSADNVAGTAAFNLEGWITYHAGRGQP